MKEELAKERLEVEHELQCELDEDLKQLRVRLKGEVEEEKEVLKEAHQEEIMVIRLKGKEELTSMKEALEKKKEDDIKALRSEKEKKHVEVGCACCVEVWIHTMC